MSVARSLTEVVKVTRKGGKVTNLLLKASKDLVCNNLWCEKVTGPCICRLERTIQDLDQTALEKMDLSGNKLTALPPGYPDGFTFPPGITPNTASYFERGW